MQQQKTRRSKTGFMQFLAAQTHRQDAVGIAAREREKRLPAVLRSLFGGPDRETLARGITRAMYEYDRQFKKAAR